MSIVRLGYCEAAGRLVPSGSGPRPDPDSQTVPSPPPVRGRPLRTDGALIRPLSAAPADAYGPSTDLTPAEDPVPEEQNVETRDIPDGVIEETLVEEVSIDGMCGVY
jgi:mycofactocin precursor